MKRYRTKAAAVGFLMAVTLVATPVRAGQPGLPLEVLALPALLVVGAVAGVKHLVDEAGNDAPSASGEARPADAVPQTTGNALPASGPEAAADRSEATRGPGLPD